MTFGLIPQRRCSLKNLTEGSHFFECSLSFNVLISNFYTPTIQIFRCFIVWVGVGWGCGVVGGVIPFHYFFGKYAKFIFPFLKMTLANRGNDFKFFPEPNKAIVELRNRKLIQTSTIFGQLDVRV